MDLTSETSSDESYKPNREKNTHVCTYEGCTASFSKNSKLVYHIKRHTGERPFACDYEGCSKTYLFSFHLRRHKEKHLGPRVTERVRCPAEGCYMELANKHSLKKHMKMKHNPDRQYPFNCDECQQGFFRKRQLLQHTYVHTGVYPFKCSVCDMGFPTLGACNRHKRTHTNYTCKCGEAFERWSHLLLHKKTCEAVVLKCNVCSKTFKQRSNLKTHLEVHMNERVDTYSCAYDNCTRSYLYKRNLLYHINTYHKKMALPRISCTEPNCKMGFTQRQKLLSHIKKCHCKKTDDLAVKKAPRRPRKDKGISRKTTAAKLAGLKLPPKLHQSAIKRPFTPKPSSSSSAVANCDEKQSQSTADDIKMSKEAVNLLKNKLREALFTNLQGNKTSSNSDDSESSSSHCIETC